ncbi:YbhB/YbcL family Raf kinase inhibitor-like protein [Streptacidiphilus rugosus]|uniref:YbhB/YbcL family Raf kinase inhibitor-like protein n=1 Tax=Streptacidiphilus rugosus TaxID=405783 RepID=UPI00056492CA|nr:YbhB/YbcL family Raf kinase inhibitor-like protein [Streptacidiphilus rugosus]
MTLLGRLLVDRRAGETHLAWNLPNLQGPDLLSLTSVEFGDGDSMALPHCAKRVGGGDVSPQLSWTPPPAGTAQLLLVVEDVDVPIAKPAVHCVALVDPDIGRLEPGALAAKRPAAGVRVLRSTLGRGYHGPGPIKGHGPHRYVFQLFALAHPLGGDVTATPPDRARPRVLLPSVGSPVLGRGRLTGVYER